MDYENDFRPEFNVYERVGLPGNIFGGLVGPDGKIDYSILTPIQIFQMNVDAISRDLISNGVTKISEKDIQKMIEKSNTLQYVKYKNPTAYVLGYLVTNGGENLLIENFEYTCNRVLPLVNDSSVLEPDVLRYSRLWLSL